MAGKESDKLASVGDNPLTREAHADARILRWPVEQRRVQDAAGAIPEAAEPNVARRRDAYYRRALAVGDVASALLAMFIALGAIDAVRFQPASLVAIPLVVLVSKAVGLYDRDQHLLRRTTLDEIPALFQVATLFTLVAWFGETLFVEGHALHKTQLFVLWILLFLLMSVTRHLVRQAAKAATSVERCLVVGDGESARRLGRKLQESASIKAEVVGRVPLAPEMGNRPGNPPVLGSMRVLGLILETHDIERVVIAPGPTDSESILDTIRVVKSLGVKVSVLPRLFEVVGSSVEFDDVDGITLLGVRRFGLSKSSIMLKRGMDLVGAAAVLLLLAPLLTAIAIAVKLTSPGPVLFRQRRIGREGRSFEILKFRTMVDGADAMKAELQSRNEADGFFKIAEDPRITRVGRFLRQASLDELPQLINVLKGQMSLVGPRPLVGDEDSRIEGMDRRRLHVNPGMTGFWQILGSSRVPRQEMVKLDYLYGANWSPWLDVKVLLRTVPYVFSRRGL